MMDKKYLKKVIAWANNYYKLCLGHVDFGRLLNIVLRTCAGDNRKFTKEEISSWEEANHQILSKYFYLSSYSLMGGSIDVYPYIKLYFDSGKIMALFSDRDGLTALSNDHKTEVSDTFILTGSGSIPTLYGCTYQEVPDHLAMPEWGALDAETAPYGWLFAALAYKTGKSKEEFFPYFKEMVKNYKPVLDRFNSFRESANPEVLRTAGIDNVIFILSRWCVLKFFFSKDAFEATLEADRATEKDPDLRRTEARIYDVGKIEGMPYDTPLYYYLIERMVPVEKEIDTGSGPISEPFQAIDNYLLRLMNDDKRRLLMIKDQIRSDNRLEREAGFDGIVDLSLRYKDRLIDAIPTLGGSSGDIEKCVNAYQLKPDWFEKLIEEVIVKRLTGRADLHSGNVGISPSGYLRFFDPIYRSIDF